MASQYVLVGFASNEEALEFLEHCDAAADELDRELLIAKRTKTQKVKITPVKIRTAYLKDM